MPTDINLTPLVINQMTKAQYSQASIPANELCFITDENFSTNVNALSGTSITLSDNSINTLTPTGNITFTLPTVSDTTVFHQILVQLDLSTVYTIDLGATTYFGGSAPDLSTAGNYNLIYEYDNALSAWVVGSIVKGA